MLFKQRLVLQTLSLSTLVSAVAIPSSDPNTISVEERDDPSWSSWSSDIVDLGYSKYQGVPLDAGVTQFLGMRYAAPPLGDRRWRAPQEPAVNETLQQADAVSSKFSICY